MIVELLQFFDLFWNRQPHALVFFFIATLLVYIITIQKAKRHKPYTVDFKAEATCIIPVFREKPEILERVLEAITPQVKQTIVVIDEPSQELITTVKKFSGVVLLTNSKRVGARKSKAQALNHAKYPFIIFLDSDTIPASNYAEEILKPFSDPSVGLVAARKHSAFGVNKFVQHASHLIEEGRHIVNSALNPHLVVADGSCNAFRKSVLEKLMPFYLNEHFMGRRVENGEDRCLTRQTYKLGFKAAYQPTAHAYNIPPDTITGFLKQQLRWLKTGYYNFFLDIVEKPKVSWLYALHVGFYYLSPFLLTAAILTDLTLMPLNIMNLPLLLIPTTIIVGVSTISALRQLIMFKRVYFKWLPIIGIFGLFIFVPLHFYAVLTIQNQATWGTR